MAIHFWPAAQACNIWRKLTMIVPDALQMGGDNEN
jgi:hypothetical protein